MLNRNRKWTTLATLLAVGTCTLLTTVGSARADVITTVYSTTAHEFSVTRNSGTPTIDAGIHPKNETAQTTDRFAMIRFDSASFGATVTGAELHLTPSTFGSNTYTFTVYGVLNGDPQDEAIDETTYVPNAPGTLFKNANDPAVDHAQLTSALGTFSAKAGDPTVVFSSAALTSFIQADTNQIVTLVITRNELTGNSTFKQSNDATDANKPQLVLSNAVPEPASIALFTLGGLLIVRRRKA